MRPNRPPEPDHALAARLFDILAKETADVAGVTREAFGRGEQFAHDLVAETGREIGLEVSTDAGGNLYLRLPGTGGTGRMILAGSHLDSVPMGGNFDGAAGVLAPLAVAAGWKKAGFALADDLVVVALRAEESNWFPVSYPGSKMALGLLPPETLELKRSDTGRTLRDHMAELGFDPDVIAAGTPQVDKSRIRAFVELHIEQGPTLIGADLPAAVVTGIRGSIRYREARVFGTYAHSGATPRAFRTDAVIGAADLVMRLQADWLRLEAEGRDLTFTAGQFFTDPAQHAFSKIAGEVFVSLDLRSNDPALLEELGPLLEERFAEVEAAHGVRIDPGPRTGSTPALMDPELREAFGSAMEDLDLPRFEMASGAGHDAATFAGAGVPSVMLFVRNANGSHNPDEAMEMDDFECATRLLADGLARIR
ncbi:Zn-dependent hydrolase [Acuticoccus mangrovi]|uniref:Hydantoinase/carbamoylase family amidase n=1 Tax=Acuticoccus mangrovi TaxID=2796142 RepID=A0A934IQ07_9HYPH|nr:Zn-dependent hydrolase [Acuticoccus mangrovi]MBJ3776571.1 hydantoinase/carbamoylase family amidase [Acuticoccus mangrovi]